MMANILQRGAIFGGKEVAKRRRIAHQEASPHWFAFWQSVIFCKAYLTRFELCSSKFKRTLLATKSLVRQRKKLKDIYAFDLKYRRRILLEFSVPRTAGRIFMLSVSKCRQLLKKPNLTDEEVQQIRETLYGFAEMLVHRYVVEHPRKPSINQIQ